MHFFKNLSIFQKMLLAPAFVLGLFILFFLYTYWQHSIAQANLSYVKSELKPIYKIVNKNTILFDDIVEKYKTAISAKEIDWLAAVNEPSNELTQNLVSLQNNYHIVVTKEIFDDLKAYNLLANSVAKAMINDNINEELEHKIEQMQLYQQHTKEALKYYVKSVENQFDNKLTGIENHLNNILFIGLLIGIFSIFLSIGITFKMALPIKRGLKLVLITLENLASAKPELENTIEYSSGDEIGAFVSAFNKFSHKIHLDYLELAKIRGELEVAKQKAEDATESKSMFLANMSHEIRTPMSAILGMSHLVGQTELNEKQKEYILTIDASAKSLLAIINDILDFSKIEAGQLSIEKVDFNLDELMQNLLKLSSFTLNAKDVVLSVEYGEDVGESFCGDSLRLGQVITNLLSNAIKFTKHGEIKVLVKKLEPHRYSFEVKDSGIGLTQEQQERLFKSFSQADATTTRKYGGTGLGLSISKQLCELMGGRIWVESVLNVGSSFLFEIELQEKEFIAPTQKNDTFEKLYSDITALNGSEILVVDDNITNQDVLIGLLEHTKIKIDLADNGEQAVAMFKKSAQKYELILMDLQMPIMDGYKATEIIRKIDKNIPILALTANVMQEDINRAEEVGMNGHLKKPIEIENFYTALLNNLSTKETITQMQISENDVPVVSMELIDTKRGIELTLGNRELYFKILTRFCLYKSVDFAQLEEDEYRRVIHTIKGESGTIGAMSLYEVAKELDASESRELLARFVEVLLAVIQEIQEKITSQVEDVVTTAKKSLSERERKEYFTLLLRALETMQPKECEPIINKLKEYQLQESDAQLFESIQLFIEEYEFDEASEILKEALQNVH